MSLSPHVLPRSRDGKRMGNWEMVDTMIQDGLWCAFNDCHMGITAENIAAKYEFSRAEQDLFAATSQQRTEAAQKAGHFDAEIFPSRFPSARAIPSSSPRTNSRAPAPPRRAWAS
jgi:acetyl-CoA C-acetyltransferase